MPGTASAIWRQNLKRETGETWRVMEFVFAVGVLGWNKALVVGAGCASLGAE